VRWFDTGLPLTLVHPLNAFEVVHEEGEINATKIVLWTPLGRNFSLAADLSSFNTFHMSR
jgi:hypothetical protein